MKRASGILLPVASLPSAYGIGAFSKEAYRFVKQLEKAGQSYWQILPLGPTGFGDSPYQSFSTFAGNPYFIDLEALIKKGWLEKSECDAYDFGEQIQRVDYGKLFQNRFCLLKKAFQRSGVEKENAFQTFCEKHEEWLNDYAMFMVLKELHNGKSWCEWEDKYRFREKEALTELERENENEILFQKFLQYEFFCQWDELKKFANKKGIQIIGDIPIYVAFDSADSWANTELFQFDGSCMPVGVAGCPPDAFCSTGQLWGNPLYNWNYHKDTGYRWWLQRMAHCGELYDVIRIDHFRGFDEYYAIPYGDPTAEFGTWEKGPGLDLFRTIKRRLGEIQIIAEDLGFLTDSVLEMVKESEYPGMKVLEFAFDAGEPSDYLPHNYGKNCVVYTGTHDNETLAGWYKKLCKQDRKFIAKYTGKKGMSKKQAVWEIIRLAHACTADTCIIPIQDYLGLPDKARINQPSTIGDNWTWRLEQGAISQKLLKKIYSITKLYGRLPGKENQNDN